MVKDKIEAYPRKKLFIDILTQDVTAEECILDLIDNSVDSYIKNKLSDRREIKITINGNLCEIYDNCGGIDKDFLKKQVFRFGSEHLNRDNPTLGMYGIGLKRSIFKMGNDITIETDDGKDYSLVIINVNTWESSSDENDWSIPFDTEKSTLKNGNKTYTKIKVATLHDEIKEKFSLDTFKNDVSEKLRRVYCLTMKENIDFFFNGSKLEPYDLIVPQDNDYKPSVQVGEYEGVKYKIICFIDPSKGTKLRNAINIVGWNLFCNGRLILANDTSKTTGWRGKEDKDSLPKYHPIYNEFRGLVFLQANNPFNLPLNTAKSDLNIESKVYQHVLNQMIKAARPVINYLSRKYDEVKQEEDNIEEIMTRVDEKYMPITVNVADVKEPSEFKAPEIKKVSKESMSKISYSKPTRIVKKTKDYLGVKDNRDVGIKTFDYFVEMEGIDNE